MDILTQYYNHGGQIVSKSPDLATREFYRDVLFRHRFDEMFCATVERDRIGYYATASQEVLVFGDGDSCTPATETGGSVGNKAAYGFEPKDDGGMALYATEDGTTGFGGVWALCPCELEFLDGTQVNIGFTVKTPSGYPVDGGSESIFTRLLSQDLDTSFGYLWAEFRSENNGGPSIGCQVLDTSFNINSAEWMYEAPALMSDGSWNLFELQIKLNSYSLAINGTVIHTGEYDGDVTMSITSLPRIVSGLYTSYFTGCTDHIDKHPDKSMSRLASTYVEVL
jgi:hypothetical protein